MTHSQEVGPVSLQDEETSIDLCQYLALLLQWWWLVVLAGLLVGGGAYFVSRRVTPIYESSTTLLINEAPANKATEYNNILTSERLAKTYAQMIVKRPVLEEVIERLGIYPVLPEDLAEMVTVTPVRDTQLIIISVESTDPNLSAGVANALVLVFTEELMVLQSSRFAAPKENLQNQIADSESQIAKLRGEMDAAKDNDELARLETRLNQYEQINANLVMSYEQIRTTEAQSASNVEQIETAVADPIPVRPTTMQNTLLAMVVGVILAVSGVFIFDALDDTLKNPEDIRRRLNLAILGTIPHYDEPENEQLVTRALPRSPVAESFRALRLNVQYSSVDQPLRTLLVTSPTPADGKTTIASNLAVVMSHLGKTVTVLDADLHRPHIHLKFNTSFQPGLGNLFIGPVNQLNGTFQETGLASLHVVSAGRLPPNPAELLGSKRMQEILSLTLEKSELVIIDTPPILSVTDATVLAPQVDGVLLVVKPGVTKLSMLEAMVEQLRHVGARVIGVVINGVEPRNARYGYYYKGYAYQMYKQYGGGAKNKKSKLKKEKQI